VWVAGTAASSVCMGEAVCTAALYKWERDVFLRCAYGGMLREGWLRVLSCMSLIQGRWRAQGLSIHTVQITSTALLHTYSV
jgi:hypothetical protein